MQPLTPTTSDRQIAISPDGTRLAAHGYVRSGTTLASFGYSYTPAGRRSTVVETGATTSFVYDQIGRLVQEARVGTSPYARTYAYDSAGNRTQTVAQGVTSTYTYDSNDRLLTAGNMPRTVQCREFARQ